LGVVFNKTHKRPKILIMGALGRSGNGCVSFAEKVGILDAMKWDLEETKLGGPFNETIEVDVFVNCIYLNPRFPIPPFITKNMLTRPERNLSVLVDVSCDTSNPLNPVPIYTQNTSFLKPCDRILSEPTPLDVVSIDHLPSLVPLESSTEFSGLIIEHFSQIDQTAVWKRAEDLFREKIKSLPQQ